jgi:hypothetical protein
LDWIEAAATCALIHVRYHYCRSRERGSGMPEEVVVLAGKAGRVQTFDGVMG